MKKTVTVTAPVNIAAIKYWGKRDSEKIIPMNDSISFTLCQDDLCSTTTAMTMPMGTTSKLWLNNEEVPFNHPRIQGVLKSIRKLAESRGVSSEILDLPVRIASMNNFPTAAGMASSAAGYAALTAALGSLYGLEGNLSAIARAGSGSACRSMFGGFVRWISGTDEDNSVAIQLAPVDHWPTLRFLFCVAKSTQKSIGSTVGMQHTIKTSHLYDARMQHMPAKLADMVEAIKEKDFPSLAELTMRDSNMFHAVCLDTYPPLVYLNEASHRIINFVHEYNDVKGAVLVGYTFDAGPNACLFCEEENFDELAALIESLFKSEGKNVTDFYHGTKPDKFVDVSELVRKLKVEPMVGGVEFVIGTKLGDGPRVLEGIDRSLLGADGELVAEKC